LLSRPGEPPVQPFEPPTSNFLELYIGNGWNPFPASGGGVDSQDP
jgi:hypothetical protein